MGRNRSVVTRRPGTFFFARQRHPARRARPWWVYPGPVDPILISQGSPLDEHSPSGTSAAQLPDMRICACLVLLGCATTAPSDPFDIDPATGGAADGAGFPVLDVEAGERLSLSVAGLPAGASLDEVDLADHVIALRVHANVAIVARRTSGDLDPYAIVKDTTKRTLAQSTDQMIAPALDARDAIVISPSGTIILVSGEDLQSGGDFTVDVIALPHARQLPLEGTIARATGTVLRELEPARADAVAKGYLVERTDGGVDQVLSKIPLAERAAITRLAAELRETRDALASGLAADAPTDALANLATIWSVAP
jgi:hypothetical protein